MPDISDREPDPLADLLGPPPLPGDLADLRRNLQERTAGAVRRRRRWRRLAWAGALAASYAAGVLTPVGRQAPLPPPEQPGVARQQDPDRPAAPRTARAEEWQALESAGPRPEQYVRAGDRYLDEEGDVQSAVRCYGQALNLEEPENLALDPKDNWLLMAIKDARKKEQRP